MINHIWAILWKQLKDTLKNKTIFCFPWIPEKEVRIQSYRFKILSEYALQQTHTKAAEAFLKEHYHHFYQ